MDAELPPDIRALQDQLEAAARDAKALVAGLSEKLGTTRPEPGSWSVAECLNHLATANREYVAAMKEPATSARTRGTFRRRPAMPGFLGGLFARSLEPPPKSWYKLKSPRKIRPAETSSLAESFTSFITSQADVRAFLRANADLDLAGIRFPNPFIRGFRFSLATGLHAITAHERRHLLQAWRARQRVER